MNQKWHYPFSIFTFKDYWLSTAQWNCVIFGNIVKSQLLFIWWFYNVKNQYLMPNTILDSLKLFHSSWQGRGSFQKCVTQKIETFGPLRLEPPPHCHTPKKWQTNFELKMSRHFKSKVLYLLKCSYFLLKIHCLNRKAHQKVDQVALIKLIKSF